MDFKGFFYRVWYDWLNLRKNVFCPLAKKNNWKWLFNVCDCQRYEPKYIWVWVCSDCGKLTEEGKPKAIYKKFLKGTEPTEKCTCAIIPPIEKVERTICLVSGLLARGFCLHTEVREYNKGTEPTEKCDVHDFVKSKRDEEKCAGMLGFFLSFIRQAWNPKDQMKTVEEHQAVFSELARRGYKYVDWFMWLCDNKYEHKYLNDKTPFYQYKNAVGKRMFDLMKWDERFWELFEIFIKLHKQFNLVPVPQILMARYCDYPFENNRNKVRGFWDKTARDVQYDLIDKTVSIVKGIVGKDFLVKFVNEPQHGGSDSRFHTIAEWHHDMFWHGLCKHFDTGEEALSHLVIDNSGSEAGQLLLVWHHGGEDGQRCPKCGKLFKDIFGYSTEEWMGRLRIGEQHTVSIVDDLEAGHNSLRKFFGSANRKVRWHEDGGASDCSKAHGYHNGYCFANAEEYGKMCAKVWKMQAERGRGKICYICIFPAETLFYIDKVFLETYRVDTINWDRFDEMVKMHKKYLGD